MFKNNAAIALVNWPPVSSVPKYYQCDDEKNEALRKVCLFFVALTTVFRTCFMKISV